MNAATGMGSELSEVYASHAYLDHMPESLGEKDFRDTVLRNANPLKLADDTSVPSFFANKVEDVLKKYFEGRAQVPAPAPSGENESE